MPKNSTISTNSSLKGMAFVLCAAILWGTTGTSQALAPATASPLTIGAMRLLLGGTALAIFAFSRGGLRKFDYPLLLLFAAGFFVSLYQVSFFTGVKLTGVAAGTIVGIGSAPFFAGILDYLIVKKKPGKKWYASTLLAVTGCTILTLSSGNVELNKLGLIFAMGAGFSYAAYALSLKLLMKKKDAEEATAAVFVIGALFLSPILFFYDLSWLLEVNGWLMMIHLGIFATALSYYLFSKGLESIPVSSAVTLSLAEPLTAAILGVVIVGERLSLISSFGLALILSGILILILPSSKKQPALTPSDS